jgi:acetate kinase
MPGAPIVLCLNAGSSSLKFSVWDGEESVGEGEVEGIGQPEVFAWLRAGGGMWPRNG